MAKNSSLVGFKKEVLKIINEKPKKKGEVKLGKPKRKKSPSMMGIRG